MKKKKKKTALRHHPHLRFFLENKLRDFPIFFRIHRFIERMYSLLFIKLQQDYKNRKIAKSQNRKIAMKNMQVWMMPKSPHANIATIIVLRHPVTNLVSLY